MKTNIALAIIDDFAPLRQQLCDFMRRAGFTIVFEAENGQECLEKLTACERLPEVLILDIDMPKMNGFVTARHIKQSWPQIRIIMYSLKNDSFSIKKAMQCGADLFLSKSCEASELLAAIYP